MDMLAWKGKAPEASIIDEELQSNMNPERRNYTEKAHKLVFQYQRVFHIQIILHALVIEIQIYMCVFNSN